MAAGRVHFLVVGTPRSGTTLVQRLACELEGVCVPPETHFFRSFAAGLVERRTFPLREPALREELARFAALETCRDLPLDAEAIVAALAGRCRSALELFAAIVRQLAGEAAVVGEKTPSHLRWCPALTTADPALRLVGVVRDPRGVVDSYFGAWGRRPHAVVAERWRIDQAQLRRARAVLRERALVLRYEDVVHDPGAARAAIAGLLGVPAAAAREAPAGMVLPWETWKRQALGPIDAAVVDAWGERLTGSEAREIARVCGREMRRWGYDPTPAATWRRPVAPWARRRYRRDRRQQDRAIGRLAATRGFA